MAKMGMNVSHADTRKLQEIIGRALTDKKFLTALKKDARKALSSYQLEAATVAQIEKGLKIQAQVDALEDQLAEGFGLQVQMG
jgi:regulator of replication initiation timing